MCHPSVWNVGFANVLLEWSMAAERWFPPFTPRSLSRFVFIRALFLLPFVVGLYVVSFAAIDD